MTYIGRFAPSPSGALHFGSLIAAIGSYLQAKKNNGKWLVRMEDIDPPREVKGAADNILRTLEAFGLHWDDTVLYQHTRYEAYQAQLENWLYSQEAYYCSCTRKQIQEIGGLYKGKCRTLGLHAGNCAMRIRIDNPVLTFEDRKHGTISLDPDMATEDFIVKRRDGLFAYNLAVVLDDIYQGVTEVVRGADLIEPTGRQVSLYQKLEAVKVNYLHLPLALNHQGNKLSKQNHASAIDKHDPAPAIAAALDFLGHRIPDELQGAAVSELLAWARTYWDIDRLPKQISVNTAF